MADKPWLSLYPPEIPGSLAYESKTVCSYLTDAARQYPEKKALHFMGKEMTYKAVYDSALKFARYLKKLGIDKGDRVAIMLPNSPQAVIGFYGVLYAGAVAVQTNPLYTERELEYQLKDSGSKVILTVDFLYPVVAKVMKKTELEHVVVTVIKDYLPFPKNFIYPFVQKKQMGIAVETRHEGNHHLLKNILAEEKAEPMDIPFDFEEDLAILQYTGGTTGVPKGVMLTHKNLVANATMCGAWNYKAKKGEEIVLGMLPFFHVYGMTTVLILSIMQAYKIILVPKFDAASILKIIEKQRPTIFPGAPTIYIGLLNHPKMNEYDLSSIEACLSGSAPLPAEVQEKFEKVTGGNLVEGYGLSESSPVTHANFIWGGRVKGSIGVPWPDTDCAILSLEDGKPLPPGEVGELAVKGPQIMKGYWNRPEETAQVLKDGWLMTGDLAYMDEKGYFYIVDRKKDIIIAGGYNIYPREIEEVLYEHPAVREAVAIGVPHPYRGETVKAFIVFKDGQTATEEELDQFARKYLAAYKVPRIYEFRSELPKTAVGKILRRTLVAEEKKKMENSDEKTG
ncbi:long-chain-fatty-acid--CoA ligase [Heyndrickxia acidiproducens]|uniref:long-chain-fatty-acid--CoA ligase n=1 Tax=Heyndrickxia acidiproducens TaxID=1121084 RepID=UPI00035CA848|nr:long-chain-fatty-acid--CoA ligase [Heyndrickxia acidiproducens]